MKPHCIRVPYSIGDPKRGLFKKKRAARMTDPKHTRPKPGAFSSPCPRLLQCPTGGPKDLPF